MHDIALSRLQHAALNDAIIAPLARATDGQGGWLGQDGRRYTQRTTERLRMMAMLMYRDDARDALMIAGAGRRALKVQAAA